MSKIERVLVPVVIFVMAASISGCEDEQYRSNAGVVSNNGGAGGGESEENNGGESNQANNGGGVNNASDNNGSQCLAEPECPPDFEETEGPCDDCEEVTECNRTILCEECGPVPGCAPGLTMVDACPPDAGDRCFALSTCGGGSIFCVEELPCAAVEVCAPHEIHSEEPCDGDELGCREINMCGDAAYCRGTETGLCHQVPDCGAEAYDTQDECTNDGDCFGISLCGMTISCNPNPDFECDAAPFCEEGQIPSRAPCYDDEPGCTHSTVCGATLYCRDGSISCASPPSCEEGAWLTQRPCNGEEGCTQHYQCATFVTCRTPGDVNCDGIPDCNGGMERSERPCRDGEEGCFDFSACGITLFCRQ